MEELLPLQYPLQRHVVQNKRLIDTETFLYETGRLPIKSSKKIPVTSIFTHSQIV